MHSNEIFPGILMGARAVNFVVFFLIVALYKNLNKDIKGLVF